MNHRLDQATRVLERIRPLILNTPFIRSDYYSEKFHSNIYFKLENIQHTHSFKCRGASAKILEIVDQCSKQNKGSELEFVCASGGNHGLGVVYAARKAGYKAHVFVFESVSDQKKEAIKSLGGQLHVCGKIWNESNEIAMQFTNERPGIRYYIHPFDDETVILGQGTIAIEMVEQFKQLTKGDANLDAVVVSVGGGGLSSGVASVLRELSPETKVYIVETTGAATMHTSLMNGKVTMLDSLDTICEGLATKVVSQRTLDYVSKNVQKSFLVTDKEAMHSLREILQHDNQLTEPSSSCSVAALPQIFEYHQKTFGDVPEHVAVVLCGGNFSIDRLNLLRD
jgi:threonine dehydratase